MRRITTFLIVSVMLLNFVHLFDHGSSLNFRTDDHTRGNITYYNSTTFYVTQNITIASGETWIFDDTTVIFNCSYDGEFGIEVLEEGRLIIRNGSLFTINRTDNNSDTRGYNYFIESRGYVEILRSSISHAGWSLEHPGVMIGGCRIQNSVFIRNFDGITITAAWNSILNNNSFLECENDGISGYFSSNSFTLRDNTISDCGGWGFYDRSLNYKYDFKFVNNTLRNCTSGVYMWRTKGFTARDNHLENITGRGFEILPWILREGDNIPNYFISNEINNASTGIFLKPCRTVIFKNNRITNCSEYGMHLDGGHVVYWASFNVTITENELDNCTQGSKLRSLEDVAIEDNLITNCVDGIFFSSVNRSVAVRNMVTGCDIGFNIDTSSRSQVFTKNGFDNILNVIDPHSSTWFEDGYGNYWAGVEDYPDLNGDGIVDHRYDIDENSRDYYPLIVPWGQPFNRKIEMIKTLDQEVQVGLYLNISLQAIDPDGDLPFFELAYPEDLNFEFDNFTGEISLLPEMDDLGRHRFDVSVSDQNGTFDGGSFFIDIVHRNLPPSILNTEDIEILAGEEGHYFLNTYDPNGDHVTVSLLQTDATFLVKVRYDNYLDVEPGINDAGVYSIELHLDDNNGTQSNVTLRIEVIPINVEPQVVQPDDQEVFAEEEFSYQLEFYEPNDDPISLKLNYSGSGPANIDERGMITITPGLVDVGEQVLHIFISDGNGSEVMVQMCLTVILNNFAPVAPLSFELTIESGGKLMIEIPYIDPDGDRIEVEEIGFPHWAKLDIELKRLTMEPEMDSVGSYRFSINVTDIYGWYAVTNLMVHVSIGAIPETAIPSEITVHERERVEIDLLPELSGNRTAYIEINKVPDFCRSDNDLLYIEPNDGDHGHYFLEYTIGAVNGISVDRLISLAVGMNLSTLSVEMKGVPEDLLLTEGDTLELRLEISGYSGPLTIVWEISLKGYVVAVGSGPDLTRTFNESGTYTIVPYIKNGPALADGITITVQERGEEESGPPLALIMLVFLFLSALVAGLVIIIVRRRKEEVDAPVEMPIPFRAAPAIAPAEQRSEMNNKGEDLLEGDELPSLPPVKVEDGNK